MSCPRMRRFHFIFFFYNDTPTTEIYTLSLHDALPIFLTPGAKIVAGYENIMPTYQGLVNEEGVLELIAYRSEEHTSELQSHSDLVCRLLLEKKKKTKK